VRFTSPSDFGKFIPGYSEVLTTERRNRAIAFLGLTRTVCGVEVVPFCPKHRLALGLVENGFMMHGDGGPEDVLQVLWHLSPLYEQRFGPRRSAAEAERKRLAVQVLAGDPADLSQQVRVFLASQFADRPEIQGDDAGESPDYSDHVHWVAIESSFWMSIHGGFTLESYLSTPYLVLQQLRRAWKVNNPDRMRLPNGDVVTDHPIFRNFSDKLAGDWQVEQRAVIALAIKSRTERLPN
jgi:hypothetical protein